MSVMDSVTSDQSGSSEKAISVRIPRKYPPAPEGVHKAICISAEVKEVQEDTQYAKKGDKRIHFGWEIQGLTYQDSEGQDRKYRVWSKPMTMMFKKGRGKVPNVVALMQKLTGYAPFTVPTKVQVDMGKGNMRTFDGELFDQKMVENMECNLVIAHDEWQGEMRAGIESYTTTEDMRKSNFLLLPPEARSAYNGMPVETETDKAASPAFAPATTVTTVNTDVPAPVATASAVEQARQNLRNMTTIGELEAFKVIVLNDMNPDELASLQPDIDELKKRIGMA